MHRHHRAHTYRLSFVVCCLAILSLLLSPTQNLFAQDVNGAASSPSSSAEAVDEAGFLWQNASTDAAEGDIITADPADVDKGQQFEHSLYLPGTSSGGNAEAAATDAAWYTVHYQTFEGNWPSTGWVVSDYNGSVGGTRYWDDANLGYNSSWSAHPNDSTTYANYTDTWMRYGPFSLVGARNAQLTFVYWLNSQAAYDFFSWEYSCNGVNSFNGGQSRSGALNQWLSVNTSLASCIGYSNVYVRFHFRSNGATTGGGAWVDNIRIQKYQ